MSAIFDVAYCMRMEQQLCDLFTCLFRWLQFRRKFMKNWGIHAHRTPRTTVKDTTHQRINRFFNCSRLYLRRIITACTRETERARASIVYVRVSESEYVKSQCRRCSNAHILYTLVFPSWALSEHANTQTHIHTHQQAVWGSHIVHLFDYFHNNKQMQMIWK